MLHACSYLTTLPPPADGTPPLHFEDICPASFMFFPAKPADSERDLFIQTATRLEAQAAEAKATSRSQTGGTYELPGQRDVIWIVKPSDGCKGVFVTAVMCMCVCHMHVFVYERGCGCGCGCICVHICMCMCMWFVCACIEKYIYTYMC